MTKCVDEEHKKIRRVNLLDFYKISLLPLHLWTLFIPVIAFWMPFTVSLTFADKMHQIWFIYHFSSGSQRASFLVSRYGRSQLSRNAISVDSQDKLYVFQTHAGKCSLPPVTFTLPEREANKEPLYTVVMITHRLYKESFFCLKSCRNFFNLTFNFCIICLRKQIF